MDIPNICVQIAEKEKELAQLREEKRKLEAMTPVQQLATIAHDQLCHYNHSDACDWLYDTDWEQPLNWSHKKYLTIAQRLLNTNIEYDTLVKIIKIMGENY